MRTNLGKWLASGLAFLSVFTDAWIAEARRFPKIEITVILSSLNIPGDLDDGCGVACIDRDHGLESYGTLNIDGKTVLWNDHRCEGNCFVRGTYTTDIWPDRTYPWHAMSLSLDGRLFKRSNNVVTITRNGLTAIARPLVISYQFKDHDRTSGDDVWCRGRAVVIPAGRTEDEWAAAPATFHTIAGSGGSDGSCNVVLRVNARKVYAIEAVYH
jgi:hypothetical protein